MQNEKHWLKHIAKSTHRYLLALALLGRAPERLVIAEGGQLSFARNQTRKHMLETYGEWDESWLTISKEQGEILLQGMG